MWHRTRNYHWIRHRLEDINYYSHVANVILFQENFIIFISLYFWLRYYSDNLNLLTNVFRVFTVVFVKFKVIDLLHQSANIILSCPRSNCRFLYTNWTRFLKYNEWTLIDDYLFHFVQWPFPIFLVTSWFHAHRTSGLYRQKTEPSAISQLHHHWMFYHYSIYENVAQKIDCYVDCVASGPVLLKPNVVHVILFNFWKQNTLSMARQRSPLTVTVAPCSFSKKNGPMMPPYQNPHQAVTHFGCINFSMMTFRFSGLQMRQFCLLTLLLFWSNNWKCTAKLGCSNGVL